MLILLTQVTILRWPEYVRIDSKDCKSQNFKVKTADAVKNCLKFIKSIIIYIFFNNYLLIILTLKHWS